MFDTIKGLMLGIKIFRIGTDTADKVKGEATKMDGKQWWKSKTIWFNLLTGALTAAVALKDSALASDPKVQAGVALFITVGNVFLRIITDQPITNTPTPS